MHSRIMALVMVLAMALSAGCVTRSSKHYGYVDPGGPQMVAPQVSTTYIPIQPGTAPPKSAPLAAGQQFNTLNNQQLAMVPQIYDHRMTYEHNEEEFSINDAADALLKVVGAAAIGVFTIDHVTNYNRWNHRRHWW